MSVIQTEMRTCYAPNGQELSDDVLERFNKEDSSRDNESPHKT